MARIIESVVGHTNETDRLFQLKNSGRWPHALLFVGPASIGKKKLALAMAQTMICSEDSQACGKCPACLRVEKQQSESLFLIEPDRDLARPIIKVDKIRSLLESLSLAAIGQARVIIIDDAQTMNPQAANSLLKTLEEPTENVFFILIANDEQQFLPTIRSRTQVIRFSALSYEQLKSLRPGFADWMYRSSRGQLDKLELLSSEEGSLQREESLQFLEQFCGDENFLYDKSWRDAVKDRSWAMFNINCWLQMVRDAIVLQSQANKFVLNTDQSTRLKKLYTLPAEKLLWLSQKLINAEKDLTGNADASLVFEEMWVQYARVD